MRNKIYLIGLCCVLFMSCNNGAVYVEKVNGHEVFVCKANELGGEVEDFLLSELVESVDVVRLETNDSCLVKEIWKIVVSDNYIGILEHDGRPYKLFDRKGRFVTNVGRIGQGPHEYNNLINASIDEKNNRIYLMPFARTDALLCYDLEGNPHDDIPLYYKSLDKGSFFIKDDIITVFSMPITNKEVFAFQQNLKGELIKTMPATENLYSDTYDNELFTSYNKGVFSIHYTAIDTLFNYDPESNTLIPRYCTQFEEPAFQVYRDLPNHYITLSNSNIIVDKKTKKANYYKTKNDFLGGLDVGYFQSDNDYVVVRYDSSQLLEDLQKNINNPDLTKEVHDRMSNLIDSISEDDNPVLIIGRLK